MKQDKTKYKWSNICNRAVDDDNRDYWGIRRL